MNNMDNKIVNNTALDEIDQFLIKKFGEKEYLQARERARFRVELARIIKQRRIELNMDQKELAKKLQTSQQQLSKYEVAENSPTVDRLYELCLMLELEMVVRDPQSGHELLSTKRRGNDKSR